MTPSGKVNNNLMWRKTMTNDKKKPALKLKLGRVNLAIFENNSERGTWYSLSLDRVYKAGDTFKRVSSFPEQEFDNVKLAVEAAKEYIATKRG
jgi:hypothetical protein